MVLITYSYLEHGKAGRTVGTPSAPTWGKDIGTAAGTRDRTRRTGPW